MRDKRLIIFLLIAVLLSNIVNGFCYEHISFQSSFPRDKNLTLFIDGLLTVPTGKGPYPSIILLHGGSGLIREAYQPWVERLTSWGYIVLQVDSFRCRKISMENNYGGIPYSKLIEYRSQDIIDARDYLLSNKNSDKQNYAIIGWSQGGTVVNHLVGLLPDNKGFKAAVSFYPLCHTMIEDINTPLLIMIGTKDNVTHAYLCKSMLPMKLCSKEFIFKILQGAHHAFDFEFANSEQSWGSRNGFKYQYHPEAALKAINTVEVFLEKYLK
ncbi:MAG: prolyl oligopeptidase family serine peptidase [Desulfobacterales bacterium]|nr:prolyl oligopeptidase family serine peptidase [Desulfobacterales bacterium]